MKYTNLVDYQEYAHILIATRFGYLTVESIATFPH